MATVRLEGPMDLELPDGSVVRIRPGPYGKGIAIATLSGKAGAGRKGAGRGSVGRPPHESTLRLRAMLDSDAAAGRLRASSHYIDWLVAHEPRSKRATLQQTAYREIRAALANHPKAKQEPSRRGRPPGSASKRAKRGGKARNAANGTPGVRGRHPHPATVALRERLAKDQEAGGAKDAAHYVRWVVDKVNIGLKQARPIVYRELRAFKGT